MGNPARAILDGEPPLRGPLNLLQLDPTAAIAPSADLIPWSRLGNGYAPAQLDEAVSSRRLRHRSGRRHGRALTRTWF